MENVQGLIGLSFSKGSFVSGAIRWFRKMFSKNTEDFIPSHAFLLQGKIRDQIIISESTNPQMRLYPLTKYLNNLNKRIELWQIIDVDVNKESKSLDDLMIKYCGLWYGFKQFVGYIWISVNAWFGREVNNPVDDEDQIVCSEYDFLHLQNIEYKDKFLMDMGRNNVAPDSIRKSFKTSGLAKLVAIKEYGTNELKWIE